MAKKQGALGKDPSQKQTQPIVMDEASNQRRLTRINYLTRVRPNDPEIKKLKSLVSQYQAANPAPTTGQISPQQAAQESMTGGAQAYQNMLNRFQNSDPYQMQSQYNPVFNQEMERQRQNVMDTFARRNQEEFQRQDVATQQQIAERGLDVNSPAAQALMKANTQRQDLARQEAMSAGETAALGAQQQYYQQAYQTGMAPYAQWEYMQQPYMTGLQAYYQQQQLQAQQDFERRQQAAQLRSAERIARMRGAGGGGGGTDPNAAMNNFYDQQINSMYGNNQQQKPNTTSSFGQGAMIGVGSQVTK